MNTIFDNVVYVDWKCESGDALFALREKYQSEYDWLKQQNFDELAENYAAEEPETFFDALGQEMTCFESYLYELDTDSDEYALIIVPIEKEAELKADLKKNKCKGIQRKQARRKAGMAAKRIDLGKRLPCEKVSLTQGYSVNLVANCMKGDLLLDYSNFSVERRFCAALLDINVWPPKQGADIELVAERMAMNENGLCAMIMQSNTVNERGYLADRNNKVLIGDDLSRIEDWGCVYEEYDLDWSAMEWFGNELFAADKNCVYYIKDIKNFKASITKVLELEDAEENTWWFPKFFVVGNQLFVFLHQVIYKWTEEQQFQQIYKIDGFNVWDFQPVGENKVAFQVRPKNIPRGETESELTVLDVITLEETTYPCHYGYVRKWMENKICVLSVNVTGKMPIIECFDFDTNEKKCLKYGALANDSVHAIYETDCGTVIKGDGKYIYRTEQLWEFMKSEKM